MKEAPQKQIIIGLHSIKAAIDNSHRVCLELIGTDDGFKNLNKLHRLNKQIIEKKVRKVAQLTPHEFQQVAQAYFRELGFEFQRIASGVLLVVAPLPFLTWQELGKIAGQKNIVALDQVTDIHNAAAIIRTCAFYGVGALILESKGSFNITPGLSRIASGGLETIPLFITSGLPATLRKLRESGVRLIGLSEEAQEILKPSDADNPAKSCLVLGAEDRGLSYAVQRELTEHVSIPPAVGAKIQSLNVSIAAAVALERLRQDF